MGATLLTRREFLALAGAATLAGGEVKPWTLVNDVLRFRLVVQNGEVVAKEFFHAPAGRVQALPLEEFLLEFDDGSLISSTSLRARRGEADDRAAEFLFANDRGLEVRVRYRLARETHYLRKQISVRQARGERRLVRVDLETWRVRRRWDSTSRGDRLKFGSHPIFCEDMWAGVEFVAAFNEFGPEGFVLRSRPGGLVLGPGWRDLHPTVVGVAPAGRVREAFLRYLEDIRLAPARMIACYNSWWTLPKVVQQQDNLALIRQLKADMADRHGVFFDIITTDMGWSNPRSIWEIDRSILPHGFDDIRAIVEPAGGKLGLWMSPSETYPPVCDYEWAERNGYVVVRPDPTVPAALKPGFASPGVSLADPKYREQTKAQLQRLIRQNGLAHIKYDGFWAIESRGHHELLPGIDSVEPLAAYQLELQQVSKAANPDLVTEPTCLNSMVTYISPWILKYSDTVWANGSDCVVGIGPAPDYRDAHTNGREFMIFQAEDQVWLPQNAVHYFDIVHVDSAEGFPNHAAMAFGRGRFFLSTYVNPKLMSAEDWRIYTGFLRWARANTELLRHTVVGRSRVELGEPYYYAHWLGARGMIAVRNPSNETREFALDLERAGAPPTLKGGVCYTQYPYRCGLASEVAARDSIRLMLAPWEVLFLEIVPRTELRETVAIGARWFRASDGTMAVTPAADTATVRLLGASGIDRNVPVARQSTWKLAGELVTSAVCALPENATLSAKPRTFAAFPFHYPADPNPETITALKQAAWKRVKWKNVPSVSFELECVVTVPELACAAQVLLLVEYPGRELRPSQCVATVDGLDAPLERRDSDEHVGYFNWTDNLREFESEWSWYLCPVGRGQHRIRFSGTAGHPDPRLGVWLWADQDVEEKAQRLETVTCSEPALPQYRERIDRLGICLLKPVVLTRPPAPSSPQSRH